MKHKKHGIRHKVRKLRGLKLSRTLLELFAAASIALVPWTIWMSNSLPSSHLDQRWDLAWGGFDVGLLLALALTAYFGFRKSGWVIVAASASGTLLLVDAWFDSVTAERGGESLVSITFATFFELPMALLAFWIAYRAGKYFFKNY